MIARSYLMASLLGTILLLVSEAVGVSLHGKNFVNIIKYDDYHLPYSSAWDLQLDLMQHHLSKQQIDPVPTTDSDEEICVGTVVICQHSPTYTLGSATTEGSGPFSKKLPDGTFLEYETFTVERAGQATFHGPGQLVVYPILDLGYFSKDIHLYLRVLEQTIMDALTSFDITSQRIEGLTGVWTTMPDGQDSKIAAIGIKLRRWVTMHGFSLNVCPDMRYFENIVPCGITDKSVTSIQLVKNARMVSKNTERETLEPEELLIPSLPLSSSESKVLLSQVSAEILLSLSSQLNVNCRILEAEEARTFVEHVTRTYGPLRATT